MVEIGIHEPGTPVVVQLQKRLADRPGSGHANRNRSESRRKGSIPLPELRTPVRWRRRTVSSPREVAKNLSDGPIKWTARRVRCPCPANRAGTVRPKQAASLEEASALTEQINSMARQKSGK